MLRIIGKKMITLPWGVYAAPMAIVSSEDINHEFIHLCQWRELWYVGFLMWYISEWLVRLLQYRDLSLAYRNISFEREAYIHETNLTYIETRRRFSFLKYMTDETIH